MTTSVHIRRNGTATLLVDRAAAAVDGNGSAAGAVEELRLRSEYTEEVLARCGIAEVTDAVLGFVEMQAIRIGELMDQTRANRVASLQAERQRRAQQSTTTWSSLELHALQCAAAGASLATARAAPSRRLPHARSSPSSLSELPAAPRNAAGAR